MNDANLKPFVPGQGGRPKGARNKFGEAFIEALMADFEQHGAAAIETVRKERPHEYLKVIASIIPKEIKSSADDLSHLTDEQLEQMIRAISIEIGLHIGGPAANDDEAEGEDEDGPEAKRQH